METTFTIHSPLLVFDRVHRRTGTIERTCLFTNRKPDELDLEVCYDFPEHSWVQIYGAPPPGSAELGPSLRLQPGENRVLLSLNTNNFNFPEGKFKGRIAFQDKEGSRDWIELNFEEVEDLQPFPGYAAIDLGTSTSTVSLYHIRKEACRRMPWTPRQEGSPLTIPSAVFVRNFAKFSSRAEGGCLVGEEAIRAYRSGAPQDPRCLQISTKRLMGKSKVLVTDERGTGGFLDPLEVLYALGRQVRERFQNHPEVHSLLHKVSVTYPPTWSYRRINRWKDLFRRLGFRDEDLDLSLDEASAAGLFYIYNRVRDRDSLHALLQDLLDTESEVGENGRRGKCYTLNLLSFDLGGGTTDLALLEARLEMLPASIRLRLSLLGSDSLDFGGDQVTLAVFRILKRRLAMAVANASRLHEERAPGAREQAGAPAAPRAAARSLGHRAVGQGSFVLPDGAERGWDSDWSWGSQPDHVEAARRALGDNWGFLTSNIASPRLEQNLEDAVETLFPTRFLPSDRDLFRLSAKRNFDWLWERAEAVKKRLFDAVHREHGADLFPSFDCLKKFRAGLSLHDVPERPILESIPWAAEAYAEAVISVGADEVYRAISPTLEEAMEKAARLVGDLKVHRVALSGQSSKIPVVRWMLSRPRQDGGLGIPPAKVDFDEENAKAAVSKGACLLHVLRETLVGYEVDIADFKANLLADLFYLRVDGSRRVLFASGAIDDLAYREEAPESSAFPKYFSIFSGTEDNLIGQFLFDQAGEDLPPVPPGQAGEGVPSHAALLQLRDKDRPRYARLVAPILQWSDRQRIAWMERTATPGAPGRPVYRFYLTRNHALFAVRDEGAVKRLHEIKVEEEAGTVSPETNPFSGVH